MKKVCFLSMILGLKEECIREKCMLWNSGAIPPNCSLVMYIQWDAAVSELEVRQMTEEEQYISKSKDKSSVDKDVT